MAARGRLARRDTRSRRRTRGVQRATSVTPPRTGAATPGTSFGERDGAVDAQAVNSIAVDESKAAGDWAAGDVYVADPGENAVDVFKPKTGGTEEYVAQVPGIFSIRRSSP